jgi:hypothetical protein
MKVLFPHFISNFRFIFPSYVRSFFIKEISSLYQVEIYISPKPLNFFSWKSLIKYMLINFLIFYAKFWTSANLSFSIILYVSTVYSAFKLQTQQSTNKYGISWILLPVCKAVRLLRNLPNIAVNLDFNSNNLIPECFLFQWHSLV